MSLDKRFCFFDRLPLIGERSEPVDIRVPAKPATLALCIWGVGILDDTSSALFIDTRNRGLQDLIVLRSSGPLLFLNQGGRQTLPTIHSVSLAKIS